MPGPPHPDVRRVVELFDARGVRPYEELGVLAARNTLEEVTRLQQDAVHIAQVRDLLVPGADGRLPARIYHPRPGLPLPLVIYLHGGGWVLGSIGSADGPCRRLARAGQCVVASIEYRRAPETKFPGPLDDCIAATRWLLAHAAQVGADPERTYLLGDSAGGNLVASTTIHLRDDESVRLPTRQMLVYPCLLPPHDSPFPSYLHHAEGPLLTRATMEWFWDHYLRNADDRTDPRAAPLTAHDLSGLPATTIVVAELDPLRDEGVAYARRLADSGVDVTLTEYAGAAHGFWWMDAMMSQADELAEQLGALVRHDPETL